MENRTLTITKIILLSIIALLLTSILIILLVKPKTGFNFFKLSSKSVLVYEKDIIEPIKKINITTKASSIQVESNNTDKISIKYYGEEDEQELNLNVANEVLNINEDSSYFCIGFCNYREHKIIISLPKEVDYELDFNTASGDIYLLDSDFSNISLNTISGDIKITNALNANLETTSGDIEIGTVEKLTAKTISGEVSVNNIKRNCDIKTTSGDIDIRKLAITNNSKISTISGDVEIETNKESYVKAKTVSGEVSISNNDRYAKTELTINTTSGDIEIGD